MNVKDSLEVRSYVLHHSIVLENVIGSALANLLDIEAPTNSYCFGNSSKALSFNQKVFLLIDIGALDDSEKTKFIKFMEIRNQFMHNVAANTFKDCFNFIDGVEKYLLKNYPQPSGDEKYLAVAYNSLVKDVKISTESIIDKLHEKNVRALNIKSTQILYDYCKNNDQIVLDALNFIFDTLNSIDISENETLPVTNFDIFLQGLPKLQELIVERLNKNINLNIENLLDMNKTT